MTRLRRSLILMVIAAASVLAVAVPKSVHACSVKGPWEMQLSSTDAPDCLEITENGTDMLVAQNNCDSDITIEPLECPGEVTCSDESRKLPVDEAVPISEVMLDPDPDDFDEGESDDATFGWMQQNGSEGIIDVVVTYDPASPDACSRGCGGCSSNPSHHTPPYGDLTVTALLLLSATAGQSRLR